MRRVKGRRRKPVDLGEQLEEGVGGLEEADALGAVVHGHDPAGAQPVDDRPRLGGADRRAVANGQQEEVDRTERLGLLLAQRALSEVAKVAYAEPVELEGEDRVGTALGAGRLVVLGGDGDDLADRRAEPAGGRAQDRRVAPIASTPLWSMCSWVTSRRSAATPSIGGYSNCMPRSMIAETSANGSMNTDARDELR